MHIEAFLHNDPFEGMSLKRKKKNKIRSDEWLSSSKVYSIYDNFSNFKFFTKSVCDKINIIKVILLNILSIFDKVT